MCLAIDGEGGFQNLYRGLQVGWHKFATKIHTVMRTVLVGIFELKILRRMRKFSALSCASQQYSFFIITVFKFLKF